MLRELRSLMARAYASRSRVQRDAQAAFATRTRPCEMLALRRDHSDRAGANGATVRRLRFAGRGVAVDVTLTARGDRCELVGWLRPPRPCRASVVTLDSRIELEDVCIGAFRGRDIPRAASSVLVRVVGVRRSRQYRTEWISL
jgi:hypothetical protein